MGKSELATLANWPKEWSVSLEVKFPDAKLSGWSNVLHLKMADGGYGSRNPAIFVCPNSHKLQICAAVNGGWNWNFVTEELPAHKWIKIVVSQSVEYVSIKNNICKKW